MSPRPLPGPEPQMLWHGPRFAWEDLLLLVAIITVVFATACGFPEHDCVTRGGMYVDHAACTAELETMQARIEYEAEQLGYRPHVLLGALLFARTSGLDDTGRWQSGVLHIRGQTDCSMATVEVAQWNAEPWTTTGLAHEAFHLAQNCFVDESVRADCLAHPDAQPANHSMDLATWCEIAAQHAHWEDAVYPAITAVNAGGPL